MRRALDRARSGLKRWSMSLEIRIQRIHEAACKRGDAGYPDPQTGLLVLTSAYLRGRGYCCGTGCRHCPYSAEEQRQAGRPTIRED